MSIHPDNLPLPNMRASLATAGALIHWVTSDPDLVERFAKWAEHCPGDLDSHQVSEFLAAAHDMLAPDCPDPVVVL